MSILYAASRRAEADFVHWLAAIGLGWLTVGGFVLALTPVPAHTAQAGWSPAFWLVLAPLCVLAGLLFRRRASGWRSC